MPSYALRRRAIGDGAELKLPSLSTRDRASATRRARSALSSASSSRSSASQLLGSLPPDALPELDMEGEGEETGRVADGTGRGGDGQWRARVLTGV